MSVAFGALVNLVGFVAGLALYAMLLVMSLQARHELRVSGASPGAALATGASDGLWIVTGLLGLVWNVGAIVFYGLADLGLDERPIWVVVSAFAALGLLPAVVVHSVLRQWHPAGRGPARALILGGYAVGAAGVVLHVAGASQGEVPSRLALQTVTVGFAALVIPLAVATRRQAGWQRALWMLALALFAVSALHLSHHAAIRNPVWLELVGHHASLPLALAILYQDYPFALGDLLLKRALSFIVLLTFGFLALGGLALVTAGSAGAVPGVFSDPRLIAGLLAVIVFTALAYPGLRRLISWIVDRALLGRVDYASLVARLASRLEHLDGESAVLDEAARQLRDALGASRVEWTMTWEPADGPRGPMAGQVGATAAGAQPASPIHRSLRRQAQALVAVGPSGRSLWVPVPTTDRPRPALEIGRLKGGRRLLSDDTTLMREAASLAARRIDAIRLANERFAQRFREQELARLATEAELRALRAQLHPHFLFNALTTIGYLIQTAPPRAFATLMRLTTLLRRVLRSEGEEATLGSELDVVEAYLDIERARFEERLTVRLSVPEALRDVQIPVFLVQPLVENAVKHGIAPTRAGGGVWVEASLVEAPTGGIDLRIRVADTGRGAEFEEIEAGRRHGTGLASLERRLKLARGERARVEFGSAPGAGTTVDVFVPLAPGTVAALLERGVPVEQTGDRGGQVASAPGAIVRTEGGQP